MNEQMDEQLSVILDGLINAILNGWDDVEAIHLRCAYRLTVINAADPANWEE